MLNLYSAIPRNVINFLLNIVDDLTLTTKPRKPQLFIFLCDFLSIKIIPGLSVLAHLIQLCSEAKIKMIYI